ncbi:uncharacterized protein LOC131875298 [Cryptomeria japonica]|uniref:uncharacterized protein LOC131875298 n=1 Tax=Cryptomeria japonica TaxID=3369 RepID=UPI0027DA1FD3|nr:uncharacterized protein LOC131875298 [Cryptomeria japonica]
MGITSNSPTPQTKCVVSDHRVEVLDVLVNSAIAELSLSLFGKFQAFCPPLDLVKKCVATRWKLKGSVTSSAMANGFFLFSFINQSNMATILTDGPWTYRNSNFLSLCKWKPNLDPWSDLGVVTPMWICLPGLPLEFWNLEILKGITNSFGNFLAIDSITQYKSHLLFVRVHVNVAINTVFPTKVILSLSWTLGFNK